MEGGGGNWGGENKNGGSRGHKLGFWGGWGEIGPKMGDGAKVWGGRTRMWGVGAEN